MRDNIDVGSKRWACCMTAATKFLALTTLSASPAFAQEWLKLAPFPTSESLWGVEVVTADHIVVAGQKGAIHETHDRGATWTQIILEPSYDGTYYEVVFPDPQHGYIFGNGPDHGWRTANGGATWARMSGFGGSSREVDFLSPTTGFLGSNGACTYTDDGGATWEVRSGYTVCPIVYGMDFRDEQVGLIAGTHAPTGLKGLWRSNDGGRSWSHMHAPDHVYGAFNDVIYLTNGTALAAQNDGAVYRSIDDGLTWTPIAPPIAPGILQFVQVGGTGVIAAVSGYGDALRSTDGGFTWSIVSDGQGDLFGIWNISFLDGQYGWIAGPRGFVLATADGGLTWENKNNGVGDLITDLQMLDEQFGLAVTERTYVQRTVDGGASWRVQRLLIQQFGFTPTLEAVSIVDEGFAVVAGYNGTVFRTFDGGVTWESVGYPRLSQDLLITDVKMIDRNTGWLAAGAAGGQVYKTTDGAATWSLQFSLYAPYAVDFIDAQHGWITTDAGGSSGPDMVATIDGGQTWQTAALPAPEGGLLSEVRFGDPNHGWAIAFYDYVARKTPAGWTLQNLPGPEMRPWGLSVVSPTEAWIVGRSVDYQSRVHHTTNGTTWTSQIVGIWPEINMLEVTALPSGHAWLAGEDGVILTNRPPVKPGPRPATWKER